MVVVVIVVVGVLRITFSRSVPRDNNIWGGEQSGGSLTQHGHFVREDFLYHRLGLKHYIHFTQPFLVIFIYIFYISIIIMSSYAFAFSISIRECKNINLYIIFNYFFFSSKLG